MRANISGSAGAVLVSRYRRPRRDPAVMTLTAPMKRAGWQNRQTFFIGDYRCRADAQKSGAYRSSIYRVMKRLKQAGDTPLTGNRITNAIAAAM